MFLRPILMNYLPIIFLLLFFSIFDPWGLVWEWKTSLFFLKCPRVIIYWLHYLFRNNIKCQFYYITNLIYLGLLDLLIFFCLFWQEYQCFKYCGFIILLNISSGKFLFIILSQNFPGYVWTCIKDEFHMFTNHELWHVLK